MGKGFLLLLPLLLAGKIFYDTQAVEVRRYEIRHAALGEVLEGLKIAGLSDLHLDRRGGREREVLEILRRERPDLVLLAGDLIAWQGDWEPVLSFLRDIKAPLGVFAVLGNTDYSNENGSCRLCHHPGPPALREEGFTILRNRRQILRINGRTLSLVGLDDPVGKRSSWPKVLSGQEGAGPSILLAHSPEAWGEALRNGVDFMFSGHTHGGQIFGVKHLPEVFGGDPALKWAEGFFRRGKSLLYVTRGVGTSVLPFRLGVRPEVVFFTFTPGGPEFRIASRSGQTFFPRISPEDLLASFRSFSRPPVQPVPAGNGRDLFDFDSPAGLGRLNWECHKWLELTAERATAGRYSLRLVLPPGRYPGIVFRDLPEDWSGRRALNLDVYNPQGNFPFHIRIDDQKSGWEYARRFDMTVELRPGMNHISIPIPSLRANGNSRPLDLKRIKRLMIFVPENPAKREFYITKMRLLG